MAQAWDMDLATIEEIRQVKYRYLRCVDLKLWDELAEVFTPDATVDEAAQLMRDAAVRRVPVVEGDRPVGIVSIGDLAVQQDPNSALAEISEAEPNV